MAAQYRPYRDEEGLDGLDSEQLAWSDHEPGTIQIYEKTTEPLQLQFRQNKRMMLGTIGLGVLACLLGFLVGYFAHSRHSDCVPNLAVALHSVRDENPFVRKKILDKVDADSIASVVRGFASHPRVAGSQNDLILAKQVAKYEVF